MPSSTRKLTARKVASLKPEATDYVTWDATVKGLGLRTWPSGRKVYLLKFRPAGGTSRYLTLGQHPALSVEDAVKLAKAHLTAIAGGSDPANDRRAGREAPTVAGLADEWLTVVEARRAPSTAAKYRAIIAKHVTPAIGSRKVASITLADASRIHRAVSKTSPVQANRVAAALSALFTYAGRQGVIPMHANPVRGLERNPEAGKERFLTDAEFQRLGEALRKAEATGLLAPEHLRRQQGGKHRPKSADDPRPAAPYAVGAIRLLALTGARVGEVLALRWDAVDLDRGFLRLGKTKTGPSVRPLGGAALALLAGLPRVKGSPYVFPSELSETGYLKDVKRLWQTVRVAADLEDVRLHDIRHSHASTAAGAGVSLLTIGKILGHKQASTTARYAHLGDDPLRRAADETAGAIARALDGKASTPVTPLKRKRKA